MTPRALLTAIGATTIGFAVVIGTVAGSTPKTVEEGRTAALTTTPTPGLVRVHAFGWPEGNSEANESLASWNDPCVIAI